MKSILLMAMSTLPDPSRRKPYSFVLDNQKNFKEFVSTEVEGCISQLEPVARLMLQNRAKTDFDIIMLCSEKTRNANGMDIDNTAADFFAERIRTVKEASEFREIKINGDEKTYQVECKDGTLIRFFDYLLEDQEGNALFGISNAVNMIRKIFAEEAEQAPEFWIAANGGLRDNYLTMSSIVSLLELDDIRPDYIFSTEFDPESNMKQIIDSRPSFRMFRFVSGINEFNRFGSAKTLDEYYDKAGIKNDPMINAMDTVAAGSMLGNADIYTDGIQDIRELLKKKDGSNGILSRSDFQLFIKNIKNDYGKILSDKDLSFIEIVERCRKKGMYPQALTFVEAKTPLDFRNNRIIYYDENSDTSGFLAYAMKEVKSGNKDEYHFVFKQYVFLRNTFLTDQRGGKNITEAINDIIEHEDSYRAYIRNQGMKRPEHGKLRDIFFDGKYELYFERDRKKKTGRVVWNNNGRKTDRLLLHTDIRGERHKNIAGMALTMYFMLSDIRNNTHHGDWDIGNVEGIGKGKDQIMNVIDTLLRLYYEYCSYLFANTEDTRAEITDESIRRLMEKTNL